jgi:hypothetical protein
MPNFFRESESEYYIAPRGKGFYVPDDVWIRYVQARHEAEGLSIRPWKNRRHVWAEKAKVKKIIKEYYER